MAESGICAPIDANGNLTSDGTRTFEWDARNQLVAVNVGTHRSEFTYDGQQRRVRVVEKESGVTQSDTRVMWCDKEICEERAADGTTVTRRAFERGEQVAGAARFFAADHLGSITEVSDTSATLLGRFAFDPWGRRAVTAGTNVTTVGFTGHQVHGPSSTHLALYRAYDADLGRWASVDPLPLKSRSYAELNDYAYAASNPTRYTDPEGLNIHGNYCGPGGSGLVTDGVDKLCYIHDVCYGNAGAGWSDNFNPFVNKKKKECMQNCDAELCKELRLHKGGTDKERTGRNRVAWYFKCD
jgi:RHS repeat-associated protein